MAANNHYPIGYKGGQGMETSKSVQCKHEEINNVGTGEFKQQNRKE